MSEHEPQTSVRAASKEIGNPRPSSADGSDVFFVTLQFRGTAYEVPVQSDDVSETIFDFVHEVLDFPQENCKLIFKGKTTRYEDSEMVTVGEMGLAPGNKLMLLASSAADLEYVRKIKADPLVKGFAEEERDDRNRKKRALAASQSAWGTKQDSEYRFGSIKAEFKYSQPPPYEAEKLLQRMATDPGIIELMTKHRFKVGVFTEMSPTEAQDRMSKRGTPNMDLLGYNMNHGDMIVLKLRTDTLKGFRPYHDLINTLIHEMTHNIWGDHDANFWKCFGELKAEYMRFHRFWSHGGQATDSNSGGQFGGFNTGFDEEEGGNSSGGFGQVLGGSSSSSAGVAPPATEAERRERALLAAEARKVTDEPVRNFLASTGTWVIVCPCGQVHDPGTCPNGGVKLVDDDDDDDDDDVAMADPSPVSNGGGSALPASANSQSEAVATSTQSLPPAAAQDVEMKDTIAEVTQSASDATADVAAIAAFSDTASTAGISVEDVTKTPAHDVSMPQAPEAASPEAVPPEVAAVPALSIADLEALGLDGSVVWVQKFSGQLQSLKKCGASSRTALDLLLKLVKNVNTNPHEPKFRKIKADNPRIQADLLRPVLAAEAETLMGLLGFEATVESGGKVFAIRDAAFDAVRLRMGQELLENELSSGLVVGGA